MAQKRFGDQKVLKIMRQVERDREAGSTVTVACEAAGISSATYFAWRKKYGGMSEAQLREYRAMEDDGAQLKKTVTKLEFERLILKEVIYFLRVNGLSVHELREAVIKVREKTGASERELCDVLDFARSTHRYKAATPRRDESLRAALVQKAKQNRRYGYRKLAELLRQEGWD
ncbi:MAG: transposase, partial [Pseudomonadota bacterium]